jgi:hypothetical protein
MMETEIHEERLVMMGTDIDTGLTFLKEVYS